MCHDCGGSCAYCLYRDATLAVYICLGCGCTWCEDVNTCASPVTPATEA
jgi:hypothetical protein